VDLDLLVLDGGPCRVGLESTVVDLRGPKPAVLRPGVVTPDRLSAILGVGVSMPEVAEQVDSPGTATSHYAPSTPTRLCPATEAGGEDVAVITLGRQADSGEHLPSRFSVTLPADPELVGSMLYSTLHAADLSRSKRIDVVPPPSTPGWFAIHDRLQRAAAPRD
jgi:L-threonylcarbamoyladenylate synthase